MPKLTDNQSAKDVQALIAKRYEDYETPYRLDPFKKIHWGTIGQWSKSGAIIIHETDYGYVVKPVRSTTAVKDFTESEVSKKIPGEHECLAFHCTDSGVSRLVSDLAQYLKSGLWLRRVNQEVRNNHRVMELLGAKFISATVTGVGSDIYGTYYGGSRTIEPVSSLERLCFAKLPIQFSPVPIVRKLKQLAPSFRIVEIGADKYGGKDKSWRQIFLQNRDEPSTAFANHPLCKQLPEIPAIVSKVCPLDRLACVMLTRVAPGGKILRHRDVRNAHGLGRGLRARIHIVLQANHLTTFSMWGLTGVESSVNMAGGELWYSDVRKPHAVDNTGTEDRLHLAVDVLDGADLLREADLRTW